MTIAAEDAIVSKNTSINYMSLLQQYQKIHFNKIILGPCGILGGLGCGGGCFSVIFFGLSPWFFAPLIGLVVCGFIVANHVAKSRADDQVAAELKVLTGLFDNPDQVRKKFASTSLYIKLDPSDSLKDLLPKISLLIENSDYTSSDIKAHKFPLTVSKRAFAEKIRLQDHVHIPLRALWSLKNDRAQSDSFFEVLASELRFQGQISAEKLRELDICFSKIFSPDELSELKAWGVSDSLKDIKHSHISTGLKNLLDGIGKVLRYYSECDYQDTLTHFNLERLKIARNIYFAEEKCDLDLNNELMSVKMVWKIFSQIQYIDSIYRLDMKNDFGTLAIDVVFKKNQVDIDFGLDPTNTSQKYISDIFDIFYFKADKLTLTSGAGHLQLFIKNNPEQAKLLIRDLETLRINFDDRNKLYNQFTTNNQEQDLDDLSAADSKKECLERVIEFEKTMILELVGQCSDQTPQKQTIIFNMQNAAYQKYNTYLNQANIEDTERSNLQEYINTQQNLLHKKWDAYKANQTRAEACVMELLLRDPDGLKAIFINNDDLKNIVSYSETENKIQSQLTVDKMRLLIKDSNYSYAEILEKHSTLPQVIKRQNLHLRLKTELERALLECENQKIILQHCGDSLMVASMPYVQDGRAIQIAPVFMRAIQKSLMTHIDAARYFACLKAIYMYESTWQEEMDRMLNNESSTQPDWIYKITDPLNASLINPLIDSSKAYYIAYSDLEVLEKGVREMVLISEYIQTDRNDLNSITSSAIDGKDFSLLDIKILNTTRVVFEIFQDIKALDQIYRLEMSDDFGTLAINMVFQINLVNMNFGYCFMTTEQKACILNFNKVIDESKGHYIIVDQLKDLESFINDKPDQAKSLIKDLDELHGKFTALNTQKQELERSECPDQLIKLELTLILELLVKCKKQGLEMLPGFMKEITSAIRSLHQDDSSKIEDMAKECLETMGLNQALKVECITMFAHEEEVEKPKVTPHDIITQIIECIEQHKSISSGLKMSLMQQLKIKKQEWVKKINGLFICDNNNVDQADNNLYSQKCIEFMKNLQNASDPADFANEYLTELNGCS